MCDEITQWRTRWSLAVQRLKRRVSVKTIVRCGCLSILIIQGCIAFVLFIIGALGKRKKHEVQFPYHDFAEIRIGKNFMQLYSYGQDLYNAMYEAIEGAHERIYMESFIWKGDEVGRKFRELLGQKAREGVEVYVIFDSFGNLVVPRSFKSSFDPAIHLLEFLAIHRIWQIFDLRRYALDHCKILVVDGEICFVGGYNIGSLYATEWRDTHVRMRGPIACDMAQSFADFWNRAQGKRDPITKRYPHHFDPLITISENVPLSLTFPIRDMYMSAINHAEQRILLTTAYFVPDHVLLTTLIEAAARGVDVRIMVPWKSNHLLVDLISQSYFMECLRSGIHILCYRDTMIHAKTCTIDGQWSTVGTANIDRLSLLGNYEINIEIFSPDFAMQMQELFEKDSTAIFELSIEEWHSRAWYVKASERIMKPWRFIM